jgi:hypothetical protein
MNLRVWASLARRFNFMVKLTCVYIGVISDMVGGKREEEITLNGKNTARDLLERLDKIYQGFKEIYVDQQTQKLDPRRQVLVTPPNGRTVPLGALQGLDTMIKRGSRVVFW